LETKIRQAWEDYKNKNKEALARIFTSDAIEVEEGAEGPHNMKATLAEIDDFNMKSYSLTDFHYRSIGSNSMLGSLQCRIHSKRSRRRDPQQIDHRRSFGKDSW
jgi:hypothetical protein